MCVFSKLFWLNYGSCRVSEASKVLVEVEMEWSWELIRFDNLVFMVVDSTSDAFEVAGESMTATAHFSNFVHFSNKIIKSITPLLINGKRILKISSIYLLLKQSTFFCFAVKTVIGGVVEVLSGSEFRSNDSMVILVLIVYQFVYFFGLYIILLQSLFISFFNSDHPFWMLRRFSNLSFNNVVPQLC